MLSTSGNEDGWYLRVHPRDPVDLRHLLRGAEVQAWLSSELGRLQMPFSTSSAKPCLADCGSLMPQLMDAIPDADGDAVLAAAFLHA